LLRMPHFIAISPPITKVEEKGYHKKRKTRPYQVKGNTLLCFEHLLRENAN